jgi:hypothetical protein
MTLEQGQEQTLTPIRYTELQRLSHNIVQDLAIAMAAAIFKSLGDPIWDG